jgi:glycosyl transferase family 4
MKRSLLIISYFFYPMISARAFRWGELATHWADLGHQVDVVASQEKGYPHEEQVNGVQIYRVNNSMVEWLTSRLASANNAAHQTDAAGTGSVVKEQLGQAFRTLYRSLYWPDAGFLWYFPALRQAKALMRRQNYDALITVSPFFTAHLVGKGLKSEFCDMLWLVDCGDPYSFQETEPHYNRLLYRGLSHHVERNVFRETNAITVTTLPTADIYKAHFPESAGKIQVIPPLLSLPEKSASSGRFFPDDKKIRLHFAGSLYPRTRRPDYLLALFAGLIDQPDLADQVELHFWGDASRVMDAFSAYKHLLESGKIMLHGMVSRELVTQSMHEASILVNIGNTTPYQLPSKVVEYGSTGKPILNLIQIENDTSQSVLDTYPSSLTLCNTGTAALADQIEVLGQWVRNLPPPVDPRTLQQWLAEFQLDAIAAKYENHLWTDA